ncbi:DUF3189 family protein [Crassaminicella thermophila]|uniref:DUF3189 family protein n=1 Tax=Crassaminicella thermophila TaxID=2599308 RepID=A0A5C0SK83_CRATE|nr:DUF3189 family protein [Crassaminicella thermophila]QEK13359.1 DUF3189 family protein [Crassaminicella thermophila]
MYIIYHDVGGTHSTVVAAAIHLNKLPLDSVPSKSEILNLPLFDRLEKKDIGRLIFHGKDEYGHSIYTISRQYSPRLVVNALQTVADMINKDKNEILCVDTSKTVNNLMRIGGASSRRLGLVSFGRPIVTYGTIKAYPQIATIVKKTKLKIAH